MLEYGLVIGVILLYFCAVTCAFFAVRIAALKGRRRGWGWLGALLGPIGLIIVCFLPNAKGVTGETNPIKAMFQKLAGISPIAVWIMVAGVLVVAGGTLLGTRLTTYLQNKAYEEELVTAADEETYLSPAEVPGAVEGLFCGDGNNFVVTAKGALYGWGDISLEPLEESGKLYEGVQKVQAVGDTLFVLGTNGALYARGDNANRLIPGQKAAYVKDFVKVEEKVKDFAVSTRVGALIKESGNLYVFGTNTYGQLGKSAEKVTNVENLVAKKVKKVLVTERSLYYLTAEGKVFGIGNNAYGQFGLGHKKAQKQAVELATGCKDLAAGNDFLLLLKKDGTVWSAGSNSFGQLGRMTAEQIKEEQEAAKETAPAEEKEEEKTSYKSETAFGQVEGLEEVTRVEAGGHSAYAMVGAEVYAWGSNHLGQLGADGDGDITGPELVHRKAVDLAVGEATALLLTEDGSLLGAGDRRYDQLGSHNGGSGFDEIAKVKEAED